MNHFDHPLVLLLLIPLALIAFWLARRGRPAAIKHSSVELVRAVAQSRRSRWGRFLPSLYWASAALLVIALAGPSAVSHHGEVQASGVDVMLAVDVSGSMQARDMVGEGVSVPISRLDAAKKVISQFVRDRVDDRIGLVAFAGAPYLASPLTLDHDWLQQSLERLDGAGLSDGTAIGSALAVGARRLDAQDAKSKILVLLTDGENNAGKIQPSVAAEAAKTLGIKVYTIGVGSSGEALIPVTGKDGHEEFVSQKVDVDEPSLRAVAATTGGKFFRASDTASLRRVYAEIDKLEKTTRTLKQHSEKKEHFAWFAVPGLFALVAQLGLSATRFLRIP